MQREIEKELFRWKEKEGRTPLIIRGARQVGKSFTIEHFGKTHFQNIVIVNFEEKPEAKACFISLDVQSVLKNLEYLYGEMILPGATLLFLDEIQNCPQALKALRYFKEKLPALHIIAAGSLLEFVLEDEENPISFPVGRVHFLNMKPLSFCEFLNAIGEGQWLELLDKVSLDNPLPEGFHMHLMQFVRDYFLIGGMPEAVKSYIRTRSYLEPMREQNALLDMYRLDLAKYAKKKHFAYLQRLFERTPFFVAKNFRYSKIDPESTNPSRDYKDALRKLNQAGTLSLVHATAANGLPLKAEENEKKFKLLFLDIGLLQCALGVDPHLFTTTSIQLVNAGVLAEQFVGQELLAYADCYRDSHLHFWETDKAGSSAEVDYVIDYYGKVLPIEVKAGKAGRLRSLNQFMEKKGLKLGLHISIEALVYKNNILTLPFYLINQISRLIAPFTKTL